MPTKIDEIDDLDDIDFIKLYKWLWHRHANNAMSILNFKNAMETFLLLYYDCLSKEKDADVKVIKALVGLNLLKKKTGKGWQGEWYLVWNEILEEDIKQ